MYVFAASELFTALLEVEYIEIKEINEGECTDVTRIVMGFSISRSVVFDVHVYG
jgi:hypothetical protein